MLLLAAARSLTQRLAQEDRSFCQRLCGARPQYHVLVLMLVSASAYVVVKSML